MKLSRQQLLAKSLAGTVSFPSTLPHLADLSILPVQPSDQGNEQTRQLRVEHRMSPSLTIIRTVDLSEVAAVFLPRDLRHVDLNDGTWLLAEEIPAQLAIHQNNSSNGPLRGIVRLPEQATVFMQVEVGMTAAESAEYYPPIACDRAVNHYQLPGEGQGTVQQTRSPDGPFFCECETATDIYPTVTFCECESAFPRQL